MLVNKTLYPISTNFTAITKMQRQMESLQMQLATGKRYNTLAEIGQDRIFDINLRDRISKIAGFQANILTVENRMSFHVNALERLDQIEADVRGLAVPGAYGTDGLNLVNVAQQSQNMLKEVIDLLNTDITGQYIFGGNKSDQKPVSAYDEMIKGPGGFEAVHTEWRDAHGAGPGGMGRLEVASDLVAGQVTIAREDPDPNANFGFTVGTITTTGGIAAPGAGTIEIGSTVANGDTVTLALSYPGADAGFDPAITKNLTLKAVDGPVTGAGQFQIVRAANGDVDIEATTANMQAALENGLKAEAQGELAARTSVAVANMFFDKGGAEVKRVQGNDILTGTDATEITQQWYHGQSSDVSRQSVGAQIDESTRAHYGVQADEFGLSELVKNLAMMSVQDFRMDAEPNRQSFATDAAYETALTDTRAKNASVATRYEHMVTTVRDRLSESRNNQPGSIESILMELGLTANTLNNVKQRHTQQNAQLSNMLADIAEAPIEEVAMQMLAMQNRLQASFQVTSMVSQLTLVNYLR